MNFKNSKENDVFGYMQGLSVIQEKSIEYQSKLGDGSDSEKQKRRRIFIIRK